MPTYVGAKAPTFLLRRWLCFVHGDRGAAVLWPRRVFTRIAIPQEVIALPAVRYCWRKQTLKNTVKEKYIYYSFFHMSFKRSHAFHAAKNNMLLLSAAVGVYWCMPRVST